VYASILSVLFGLCVLLTGYFSKNKYAVLASIRAGVLMLNLEIFLGLLLLNIVLFGESFSFGVFVNYQECV
jgi:NADH:ubiquinone oxidoreductase subunit H